MYDSEQSQPQRESQVNLNLGTLDNTIDALASHVDELASRLGQVLRNETPCDPDKELKEKEDFVALAKRINDIRIKADNVIRQIMSIKNRLEI